MKKRLAFTLVEIIVVMAVCSVLFSVSFASLRGFLGQIQLEATTKSLVSDLRKMQSQSRLEHKTLAMDLNGLVLPTGINFAQTSQIKFAPSGATAFGGSGSLVLQNSLGRTKKIIVSSIGRVRVE
ncbi:hypothetical protein A2291_04480 [candidate division WOR-1 bacterium RIFOXYB2_FULL_42_35]|uniref:General secretion pathway GspH domain-containing protein n=1 Tax=candidate division WOR-1 bacterium RIFOXYC2_FULL_41_25 TaxID=1802586 RepID=A0A1F4TRU4_UNCSA|nr:MAG: hypothetical protein A2247_07595 [candidate division WOR-1 bacterium RIFOXYA2_FULL_41_14]OGC25820.1 MAG: hypothetical protein A2291_04480 [candidate division WOR-1 bacterium RIFOXYB2_FULL_42_35]OGC35260.1 MAG: hypothetical protein A2462_08470 [candidate division WOR-1 bacterium RIFOXYC2_FULL_41_25]